ncbi:MAG: hypothetical protein ACWGNV_16425, partial [Bacteroidales bacterium]
FTTASGLTFMPMVHLISASYQTIISTGGGGMGGGFMGGTGSTLGYLTYMNLAGGLMMVKEWGPVDITLGGSYAGLNRARQLQGRIGLTWYPLGNLNLYAGAALDVQREWFGDQVERRLIPDIKLGVAIAEKVWLEAEAALGDMHNYLANNGSIVFNGYAEVVEKKAKLTLMVPVTQKGSLLYLGGRWSANRSMYIPDDLPLPGQENMISYQTLSIYGGISWKF